MNEQSSEWRMRILGAVHLLIGLSGAIVAFLYPGFDWLFPVLIGYLSFVVSEALLLGIWIGFSPRPWYLRILGGLVGTVWIGVLSIAPFPDRSIETARQLAGMICPWMFVVALLAVACRAWLVKLQRADQWPALPSGSDFRFTLRSLVGFTLLVSLILGLSRIFRSSDPTIAFVGVLCIVAVLAVGVLVWACLGRGRPAIRIPVAVVCMVAIGALVPYFTKDPYIWRYLIWSLLMLGLSAIVAASLLVVRSCGYRLISRFEPLNNSKSCMAPCDPGK